MSERIGKYEILSEIGRGSFARVYRAYDPMTQRNVAIKVLTLSNDPDALARFFLEVKATANLNHKNIVTIFDFNREPPYIVMELVEGESIKQIIAGKRLSLLENVRILRQAADGLAHAHLSGIVHRDIKPANIMVPRNGDAKIMDFGIALVSGETEARRTRLGDLIGTILYMSPERIEGAEADARADIFSFGVVGCELITGSHPFDGKDYATVIHKILNHEIPPLQTLLPECPEAFDQIIQRATAKHPEARYQSMEEILTDLKPVLLDLEQQQAAAMMTSMMQDVQGLIDAGQFDEAQRKVLTVLHLDPTNREGRHVHEFLQNDQRRKRVRAKVGTLIHEGSACLRHRQFNKAIECFESALRLDPDSDAGARLTQARAAQEALRQASRLMSEVRREISAGNLDAAYEYASGAHQADAEHPEAGELLERLQQQIDERDRLRRVEKAFRQIEELLLQNHFHEARSVLAEIRPDANRDAVQELLARIEVAEAEQSLRDREFRVRNAIAKATGQLQADLLVEAEGTLRELLKAFPDAADAAKLLVTVRTLLDGRRQSIERKLASEERQRKEVALAVRKIGEAIAAKDWPEADRQLLAAEERVPGEPAFGRLREALRKGRRSEELENLRSTVVKHLLAGELEEAARRISEAKLEFGEEPVWRDLHQQLELQKDYERILHEAEKLRLEGRYEAAEELLRPVLEGGPDARAGALLRSIVAGRIQKQRDDAIAQARREVDRLLNQENLAEALGILDRICQKYPDELALADQRKDVADRAERHRRELERQESERRRATGRAHKIVTCRTAVDAAVKAGLWEEALKAIEAAGRELPNDPALVELRRQVEDQKRRATLEILVGQVRKSLSRGDLDGAARQIAGSRPDFLDEPIWETLQEEIARHRQYESLLTDAQNLIVDARYDAAQQKLREAVALNSADGRAAALLKEIGNEKNVRLRSSVQFRLIVRRYGRAIKASGIAAALLLGVGIAVYVWRSKTPPAPIALLYKPTEVKLEYQVGDRLFPKDSVQFLPAQVDFEVTTEADWLRVSPMKGSRLDRLDLQVTKAPNTSSHVHTVLVVHAKGRPLTNDVVLIPVDLDVKGTEAPKIPAAPTPKPLTVDPTLIDIEYKLGDKAPARREIRVTQGEVTGVSTSRNWLRAERTPEGIAIDFPVDRLRELKVGTTIGFVTVAPRDRNVGTAQATVVLTVTAKAEPVVIPVIPKKDTTSKEQKTVAPPPPPPTPTPGDGCDSGRWGDRDKATSIWKGKLPANTLTPLAMEQIRPALPLRRPLTITIDEADVEVWQAPQEANHCGPITVRTARQDITVLHIRWKLASQ